MRWSVLVGVAVVVVAAVVGGVGASPRSSLVDQGYEDVVVGLSPSLDEAQAKDVIKGLRVALNDASQALFRATGNKIFFKKVKILVPSTWKSVTIDQPATNENFEDSDIRVGVRNPVYGDQVFTMQPGVCGEPGRYIHLTPAYLTDVQASYVWGPRGKVLAQAWARLRWGIFDEVGYPGDPQFPLFYHTWNDQQELVVRPNFCADQEIEGSYVNKDNDESCNYVEGLPDENCRFVPNDWQTATSSLMSFTTIDSVEELCEDDTAKARRHNPDAPNRHNLMCNGLSAWQILSKHQDFSNATKLPADHPVSPKVVIVQKVAATMALVLDYSGSMDGRKISVLANTAKRWLLHDVADGTFVTIIRFSDSATVKKQLTEVSNSTREELAAAVTTKVSGDTCIGCGLNAALTEMKNYNNKVILLVTDGKENKKPYISEVMNDVVESGARVVTISYGVSAEGILETLAQNTGGKAYIVPDDDDGSFMEDAFQGALTYQPGQSFANIDIKIYEWEGVATQDSEIKGTFPVDSTIGRNLEFRLDTDAHIGGDPFLTSPSGKKFPASDFDGNLNLWIIKVDVAESGTWKWTMQTQGPKANIKVTVTAQAKDPEILPIYTKAWMNTGTDLVDASQQTVIVYASVSQGEKPVVGAKVRAYITTPDTTSKAVELDLLDNGQNADVQQGDGIYSRYFTQFISTGRYAVKAQVWDEGNSYINNGFITSRRRRRRSVHAPLKLTRFSSSSQLVVPEYCCGSVVPFNPDTAIPTGDFTRTVAAGSINVVKMPESGDPFPPSRVTDLRVDVNSTSNITLRWTAPGDDYDTGIVFGYEVWMSGNASDLSDDLNVNATTSLLDIETSSNMTELLKEAGEEISVLLHVEESLKPDTLYFAALRAVDDAGNTSPMSRPVRFASISASGRAGISGYLNPWAIALLVIARFLGAF